MSAAAPGPLRRTLGADLRSAAAVKRVPYPSARSLADVLMLPGTWAVVLFRVSSRLHRGRRRLLARMAATVNTILFGCDLDPVADVGDGLVLTHPGGVVLGPVRLGAEARLMGNVRLGGPKEGSGAPGVPLIGDECWFFDGAKVLGPVTVGDRCVVSADSVLVSSIPAAAVVLGNPARVIRYRDQAERRQG